MVSSAKSPYSRIMQRVNRQGAVVQPIQSRNVVFFQLDPAILAICAAALAYAGRLSLPVLEEVDVALVLLDFPLYRSVNLSFTSDHLELQSSMSVLLLGLVEHVVLQGSDDLIQSDQWRSK